jgi:RimJ/RimL family protein N-acetyltransferase
MTSRKAELSGRCLLAAQTLAESLHWRGSIGAMQPIDGATKHGDRLDGAASRSDGLSLGWQTDLIFARFDGEVVDRGDHLLVRTRTNPTFWWGNFLLFTHAPRTGDLERWMALFDEEIASAQPESRHLAFGIDVRERPRLPPDFTAAGFELAEASVLTLTREQWCAPTGALRGQFAFQVLDLPHDSAAVVDQQVMADAGRFEPTGYRVFAERQMARYAAMQRAGRGHWFGLVAQVDGRRVLVASCGLFRDVAPGDVAGRFQFVSTHPAWRRRGLCTALIHAVCRHGFEAMGLRTLVMVADPDDVAISIYESIGYRRGASTWQLERAPR